MKFKEILNEVEMMLSYNDVYDILESNQVDIVYDDDLCKGVDARIVTTQIGSCLFIKEGLSQPYEQFLILHEIGHKVLHSNASMWLSSSRRLENEANMFACLWLIKNDLTSVYYDRWLIDHGVPRVIAIDFQECLQQFKQAQNYGDIWLRMEC